MKEKYSFKPGDKIFAKVKGFVYWPARVNPLPCDIVIPPNKIPIFFFGTHEVFFISPSSCWPYDDKNKAKWGKLRTRAHFSEGIDEIENNPTLFQYGADPAADDFLAQFYDFKRLNGAEITENKFEVTHLSKTEKNSIQHCPVAADVSETDSVGKGLVDESMQETVAITTPVHSEGTDLKFNLRLKMVSSNRSGIKRKSDDKLDLVSSDNSNNNCVGPTKKTRKSVTKSPNLIKNEVKTKRIVKPKKVSIVKKNKKSDPDEESLSSISSIENWQEKDEKRRKVYDEAVKQNSMEELVKQELAIKEASKHVRKRIRSQMDETGEKGNQLIKEGGIIDNICVSTTEKILSEIIPIETSKIGYDINGVTADSIDGSCIATMETSVSKEGFSEDGGIFGENLVSSVTSASNEVPELKIVTIDDCDKQKNEVVVDVSVADIGQCDKLIMNPVSNSPLNSTNVNIVNDIVPVEVDIVDKKVSASNDNGLSEVTKVESLTRSRNKNLSSSKAEKSTSGRKRHRSLQIDSDDDTVHSKIKVPKLSRSVHSDKEIIEDREKNRPTTQPSKKIQYGPVNEKFISDKVKALQTFNSDIRSSLVLGHEDYKKCLERFKSLCSMDIDVTSLVTVWQLMDTVKKCRRYKRNESVKTGAQNVFKRFLDIFSNSSSDERLKAQAILVQYRQSLKETKIEYTANGYSQNPALPTSVEEMFYHRPSTVEKSVIVDGTTTSPPPVEPTVPDKEKLDEEKMRLLSADLEAKVSDILNKIEKNSLANPLNKRSMSHLLPSSTEQSSIQLPVQWQSVDSWSRSQKIDKVDDLSDEDEDEETIVKRIEEVSIQQVEVTEEEIDNEEPGATSALDARIENLFSGNVKDTNSRMQRPVQHSNSRGGSKSDKHASLIVPLDGESRVMTETKEEPAVDVADQAESSSDNDIYDLLGV